LITDGVDGLLVDERDPAALARAIERLRRDDVLAAQLGRAARHRVERDFDLVENTRRLRAFFEDVPVHDHGREAAA
jgi:colanic acid/amylovoran biosynthesis glycosyltransferase